MINTLIKKTAETLNKETVSKETSQPAPPPALSPKDLALETAKQVGYQQGDEVTALIERNQRGIHPHLLMVTVPDWAVPVRCWVKDAKSWLPVNPPFNRLKARFTGMATNEGELIFESADICKANRLRRSR
jgi:hypothetical protein